MIYEIKGNIIDSNVDYICHQVNCKGIIHSRISRQIINKYPNVYDEYIKVYEETEYYLDDEDKIALLGDIQVIEVFNKEDKTPKYVINMFCQNDYGYNKRYTNYESFYSALERINYYLKELNKKNKIKIGFPKYIGCNNDGANWNIIYTMIKEVLKDYEIYIYEL